ncbi:MAG TPA: hypothetical protein VGX76_16485, partial [Pirellulales bacterium]|nr:hypothetical protein [Pirellulales bacterium]
MVSFLIWGTLLLGADEPAAKAELAGQVARLVRQLDSAELSQRDEAERKLLELGPDALPLLPTIRPRTPAEVSLRVTRVQQKLLRAQAAAAMEPSLVTLKGDDLPLSDVLKQIAGQTGNTITDHRQEFGEQQDDAHVKADFEKT